MTRKQGRSLWALIALFVLCGVAWYFTRSNAVRVAADDVRMDAGVLLSCTDATANRPDRFSYLIAMKVIHVMDARPLGEDIFLHPTVIACDDQHARVLVRDWFGELDGPMRQRSVFFVFNEPVEFRIYRLTDNGDWLMTPVKAERINLRSAPH